MRWLTQTLTYNKPNVFFIAAAKDLDFDDPPAFLVSKIEQECKRWLTMCRMENTILANHCCVSTNVLVLDQCFLHGKVANLPSNVFSMPNIVKHVLHVWSDISSARSPPLTLSWPCNLLRWNLRGKNHPNHHCPTRLTTRKTIGNTQPQNYLWINISIIGIKNLISI